MQSVINLIGRAALMAALAAGGAFAIRPEEKSGDAGIVARENPYRAGFKKLRRLARQDLLEQGEALRQDRVSLRGDAATQVARRLNARLQPAGGEARVVGVQADSKGNRHIRLAQTHRGIPVMGTDMVVHVNPANEVYAVGGSLAQGLGVSVAPGLKSDQVRLQAKAALGLKEGALEKQAPRLVIFDDALAYEVLIEEPGQPPALWKGYLDAATGALLHRENRILHGAPVGGAAQAVTGARLLGEDGSTVTIQGWRDNLDLYFLHNATARWGVYDQDRFDWAQNTTGAWAATDRAAISLARNMELTQGYVSTVMERNSYDNAGAFANAYAHEGESYVNAYWDGSGFHFGDGDGSTANALTVLDVTAHEYGHAITQYTSGLVYSYESGALNESYSDILGALVEFWAQPDGRSTYPAGVDGRADWMMGEDCWLSGEALRDLRNPNRFNQPSYYLGNLWYSGGGDNGGVHYNSGVQNFAFYLLSEGGAGTNDGHAYDIAGLGIQAAGEIAMYANMFLLTSSSQYRDAREAWVLAATTLGYPAQTVRAVWTACGVLEQTNNLAVSPSQLAFGNVGTGGSATASLTFSNSGALATTVTGVTFSNPAFSVAGSLPLGVPGGGSAQLAIRFTPPSLGAQSGQATIASNADDNPTLTVGLAGTGTAPAGISVTPPSVSASVAVGDTATASLSVTNTGVADLVVTATGLEAALGARPAASSLDVILLRAGDYFPVFASALRAMPNVKSLVEIDGSVATPTLAQLEPAQAVVVVSNVYWSNPTALGDVLADYVDGGGSVILMGAVFHLGGNWALSGRIMGPDYAPLAPSSYAIATTTSAAFADHAINEGMTSLTSGLYTYSTATQGGGIPLGTYVDGYLLGAVHPDKPVVSLNSFPLEGYYGGDMLRQVRNALGFAAKGSWLKVAGDGEARVIPQGATVQIPILLDAREILGGQYSGSIELAHNAPGTASPLVVPVAFAVDGFRRLSASATRIDFGNAWVGSVKTSVLTLTNTGDEATTLASFAFDGYAFRLEGTAPTVIPGGQSVAVRIAFAPTDAGSADGLLTLTSDAEDFPMLGVVLSGQGTPAPAAVLAPLSHSVALAPTDAPADRTSTLANSGGDLLQYQVLSISQTSSPHGATPAAVVRAPAAPEPARIYAEANYRQPHAPGEAIVAFKPGRAAFAGQGLLASLGVRDVRELAVAKNPRTGLRSHAGRKLFLLRWHAEGGLSPAEAIARLRQDAHVEYAEPNYVRKLVAVPDDAAFAQLYGMHNVGQMGGVADADIDAPEAWDRHTGNKSLVLGVIDTGIDWQHPDLVANVWTNAAEAAGTAGVDDDGNGYVDDLHGYDFINNDANPMDDHGHGSHCSGTIAGVGNNGIGVAGVSWVADLAGLKIFNSGGSTTDAAILNAVDYSNAMGMKITSNSWGGGPFSQSLYDLIAEGRDLGHLFIAAAGNDGSNTDGSPHYPSNYDLENIVSVAATDRNDGLAGFSNYGLATVDLGAPGVDIWSCAPGGGYQGMSGTSMATPHVAGAAFLLWSANNFLTAARVKEILLATTDPIPSLAGRTVTGGRLNVASALSEAGPAWLTASPMGPQTLQPGASAPIAFTIDPAGMVAGTWTGVVTVGTNAPGQAEIPVTVTAEISGCRSLVLVPDALDFGTRFVGQSAQLALGLRNDCNDTVTVSSAASDHGDFAFLGTLPVKVAPFASVEVQVRYAPTGAGSVTGTLSLATDADSQPVKTASLAGTGVQPPFAVVAPASVSRNLAAGASTVVDLDIGNTGGSLLAWSMAGVDQGLQAEAPYDASHYVPQLKGAADTRIGRPVTQASGGPDTFGYRWVDSQEPNGPAYQWHDISATGIPLVGGCDDCFTSRTLGFGFPMYGTTFNQVNITTNGWVNFGAGSAQYTNMPLPSTSMPGYLVAGFFDDLTTSGGNVYFQDFGNRAVIQYHNVPRLSGDGALTFQIVLHADGTIYFYYENVTGNLLSGTTGIQDGNRATGLTIQYNTSYVRNGLAVRIGTVPDWLRLSAVSGSVAPGSNQRLALTLDASLLGPGTYSQVMTLTHNNPLQAPIQVPVTLTVAATGMSRVLRVGPSALAAAAGSRYFLWNLTVGGEARGLTRGSRHTLYLK